MKIIYPEAGTTLEEAQKTLVGMIEICQQGLDKATEQTNHTGILNVIAEQQEALRNCPELTKENVEEIISIFRISDKLSTTIVEASKMGDKKTLQIAHDLVYVVFPALRYVQVYKRQLQKQ